MTNRRDFLTVGLASALAVGAGVDVRAQGAAAQTGAAGFRYALNPATIRGYGLSLMEQVKAASAAGFDGIEPWLKDVSAAKAAGQLADIAAFCRDANLAIVNGIGFAHWAMPDPAERAKGLEEMKCDMALIKELGGSFIAAPPFGLQRPGSPSVSLDHFAACYREVLTLGDRMEVTPILEFWGHSVNLSRLEEALYVAAKAGHPRACILPDVYHLYRGGSSFEALSLLSPKSVPVLHMNDYPSSPARTELTDPHRVWPGDGAAPWSRIFTLLREARLTPWLSVELFNSSYWQTTPAETLKTALAKMRRVVER